MLQFIDLQSQIYAATIPEGQNRLLLQPQKGIDADNVKLAIES